MRILSVLHYPFFGGPHNNIIRMAAWMADRNVEMIAVLPDEPGNAAQ